VTLLKEAMMAKYQFPVQKADRTWNEICQTVNNKSRSITFRLKQMAEIVKLRLMSVASGGSSSSSV
jgi:hypothetical protein